MKKLFLLLAILFLFAINGYGQELISDTQCKIVQISDKDAKETEQIYQKYQQALKEWQEHKNKLATQYLNTNPSNSYYYWGSLHGGWIAYPSFVISKDFRYLIVTKQLSFSASDVYTFSGTLPLSK